MSAPIAARERASHAARQPWLTRALAAALLAVSLLGFLGPVHWRFDLLANGRFQLALLGAVLLTMLVWRRDRWGVVVAALLVLVNGVTLAPVFFGGQPDPAPDADSFRVVTFNLLQRNRSADEVVDVLASSGADVIFVHELAWPMRRVLEADLDGYRFVEAGTDRFRSDSAALVRDDLAASPDQLSVSRFEHYPIVRLDHAGAQLELIGIHPLSPISGSRSAARDAALDRVAAWAAARPGEVIVAGDFNATPFSSAYRWFAARSGLRSTLDGAGWQPSWPDTWSIFRVPIDHVFISDGLTTVSRQVGPNAGSDHAPVIVDVAPAA